MPGLFPAGGHIRVKRPSDAVTPATIEMLMMMLTMMFITISDRTCCLYIVHCIPSTVALSSQVIATAVVAVLACGVLAPEDNETQTLIFKSHQHHHNLEKHPQMPV